MEKRIAQSVSLIRKNRLCFYSNIYSYEFQDVLDIKETEKSLVILVQDRDVKRGYFATNDLNELIQLVKEWPEGTGVEVLSRKDKEPEIEGSLRKSGFDKVAVYVKCENRRIKDSVNSLDSSRFNYNECEKYVSNIYSCEVDEIINFLYGVFNPLTSHIENKDELKARIDRGDIVVHKENDNIVTLLTFNPKPKALYMEHMINTGNSEYMHMLYYYVLKKEVEKGIISVDTWTRENNLRALNFLKRYGLIPNGVKNFVFCKK